MPEKSRRNEKKFRQPRLKQISENALHIILIAVIAVLVNLAYGMLHK